MMAVWCSPNALGADVEIHFLLKVERKVHDDKRCMRSQFSAKSLFGTDCIIRKRTTFFHSSSQTLAATTMLLGLGH
jgi:hypothetical protein